jgi:SNF2 family DNA or RNA helicase
MSVRIERAGNRILLDSDSPTPGLKTAIPGAYWRDSSEVWSLPLDLTTCHLLRERFGQRLVIGPALAAWARAEKAQRKSLQTTAAASNADVHNLPRVAPKLHAAMESRTYQRAAARFVADAIGRDGRRRALIADTVGLGKTAEAIAAVLESDVPGPYLVVCPMGAVELTWAPEIRRWLGDETEVITVPDGRAKRDAILNSLAARETSSLQRTWVIAHPALVRTQTWFICGSCADRTKYKVGPIEELDCGHQKDRVTKIEHDHTFPQLFGITWGAVIADESDQMLIRKTGTPNLQRRGMEMLRDLVRGDGCRIAMSGTPFRSKPHQAWSTLNWLDPVRWSGKWRWVQQYWETGGYSGYEVGDFIEEREHLLLAELSDVMIRRSREEVRGDLPAKLYPSNVDPERDGLTHGIYLPMTPAQEKSYRAIEKMGEAEIEGGTLNTIGTLSELTRLKQFAGADGRINSAGEFEPLASGNKYAWLVEFLKELGFPDQPASKLVVASQFTKMLNVFAQAIGKDLKLNHQTWMGLITGEQSATQRVQVVSRFEDPDDKLSLLFINTKAGGSAITLDAADIMVVLDETWVDDEQQQLEGRIDNRNPERKICPRSYYYLRSRGTVEEGIARANEEARRRGARILDGTAIAKRAKEIMR